MHTKHKKFRCVTILKKSKRDYYRHIELKDFTASQKFWKTVTPVFTDTENVCKSINLIEHDEFVKEDLAIAEVLTTSLPI